jgi:hypothetical protein
MKHGTSARWISCHMAITAIPRNRYVDCLKQNLKHRLLYLVRPPAPTDCCWSLLRVHPMVRLPAEAMPALCLGRGQDNPKLIPKCTIIPASRQELPEECSPADGPSTNLPDPASHASSGLRRARHVASADGGLRSLNDPRLTSPDGHRSNGRRACVDAVTHQTGLTQTRGAWRGWQWSRKEK